MSLPLVVASGYIKAGRLMMNDRRSFDSAVSALQDGWQVELELYRLRTGRSRVADGYYFGCVLKRISAKTGTPVSTLHEMLKVMFLSRTEVILDERGEVLEKVVLGQSIKGVSGLDFYEYVERIRYWSEEFLQLPIPDPDPMWRHHLLGEDETEGYGAGV